MGAVQSQQSPVMSNFTKKTKHLCERYILSQVNNQKL